MRWALAAHQFEGGVLNTSKRLSIADVMTAGAHGALRVITDGVVKGNYYPNHVGIDLMGYTTWGCIDYVSFTTGKMKKRYDFIYVYRDNEGNRTLERSKKDSFDWYKKVM